MACASSASPDASSVPAPLSVASPVSPALPVSLALPPLSVPNPIPVPVSDPGEVIPLSASVVTSGFDASMGVSLPSESVSVGDVAQP